MKQAVNNIASFCKATERVGSLNRCLERRAVVRTGETRPVPRAYAEIVRGVNSILDA